jgi:hypothetical protein
LFHGKIKLNLTKRRLNDRMAMSQHTKLRTYLEENPKWIGILFSALMLLSQVGTVAAGGAGSTTSP